MKKGYSLVTLNDQVIKSSKDIKINDELKIKLYEGKVSAIVKEID